MSSLWSAQPGAPARRRGGWRRAGVGAVALAAFLAACGSDDDEPGASSPAVTTEPSAAPSSTDAAPASTDAAPASTEGGTGRASDEEIMAGLEPRPLAERASVTVAIPGYIEPFLPPMLAEVAGEFEKENLDVSFSEQVSSTGLTLLASGDVDLQMVGVNAAFLNAVANGADVAFVAQITKTDLGFAGFYVRKEFLKPDGSLDVDKARGMKIVPGVGGLGNGGMLPVYEYFKEYGLSMTGDVEVVSLSSPADVAIALETGSIGGGLLLSPFWVDAREKDHSELVAAKGFLAGGYAANKDFIENEPEVAAAFFRAVSRTIATYLQGETRTSPETLELVAEALKQPLEVIEASPGYEFDPTLPPPFNDEVFSGFQEMWFELGGILDYDEPLRIEDMLDRSVIDLALAK